MRGGWLGHGLLLIGVTGCGSDSDPARAIVPPVLVARVEIVLPPNPLFHDDTLRATAVALDQTGDTIRDRPVTWAATPASVATVSSTGLLTGVSLGFVSVSATVDGVIGSTSIEVSTPSGRIPRSR